MSNVEKKLSANAGLAVIGAMIFFAIAGLLAGYYPQQERISELQQQLEQVKAEANAGKPIGMTELPDGDYKWSSMRYVFVKRVGGREDPVAVYSHDETLGVPEKFTIVNGKVLDIGSDDWHPRGEKVKMLPIEKSTNKTK